MRVYCWAISAVLLLGCLRPSQDRALSDLEVGIGSTDSVSIETPSAHIRSASGTVLELWANHPVVELQLDVRVAGPLELVIDNCMPSSELMVMSGAVVAPLDSDPDPTRCVFAIELGQGASSVRIAPADYDQVDRFRVAVMGDIQTGLGDVKDIFDVIESDAQIRFVVSTGDLVEDNQPSEYDDLEAAFADLAVPYYSTIGNHELAQASERWSRRFGRHTIHFDFKGASFSFVDTGNATIDPLVYDWLDDWLEQADDRLHLYGQHYPALEPIGIRQGAMSSRKEAAMLLSRLAAGNVDATFYGHIHSFHAYENAGIPAYISGGGGARPERWDGVGRHFLTVDLDPAAGSVEQVGLVRVD